MHESSEFPNNSIDAIEAMEILRQFEDESSDPQIIEYAHYISGQLSDKTDPEDFALTSFLALYDLVQGKDSITEKPIDSSLIGLSGEEQERLIRHIPLLAHSAFSVDFAVHVQNSLVQMGLLPDSETGERSPRYSQEIITTPIDNIKDAHTKIVQNAKHQLLQLDWGYFGLTPEDVATSFEIVYGAILRNSALSSPITLVIDEPGKQAGLLQELFTHQKMHLQDEYWLVLQEDTISPELATLAKDDLFLKGAETVAAYNHLERSKVFKRFVEDSSNFFNRAINRWIAARKDYPEFFK